MLIPLRQYRLKNALTLAGFGAMFGVNKTTILRWEAGRVPAERLPEISRLTGIPAHVLRPDFAKLVRPPLSRRRRRPRAA